MKLIQKLNFDKNVKYLIPASIKIDNFKSIFNFRQFFYKHKVTSITLVS